jgi:pimeloyl-ACP methyl ester carboxylesterase
LRYLSRFMLRRSFVAALASFGAEYCASRSARAAQYEDFESEELAAHDLRVRGDAALARRAVLLVPKKPSPKSARRLLVLFHGLGETGSEALGLQAWPKLYGLVRSYARLKHPPVRRVSPELPYLTSARVTEINRDLEAAPFSGLCLLCPVTPNPGTHGSSARTLDRYTGWLVETLLPAAREKLPGSDLKLSVGLDGCSMGGPVALEVFLRKPELFGTLGGVQSAFSEASAPRYAERLAEALARVGARPIQLETSRLDPYRKANERLARELAKRGVASDLRVIPGPHDQPWLRETGTLEMLLFHDRNLRDRNLGVSQ